MGLNRTHHFTIDADVPSVEAELLSGGRGEMGFCHTSLVGVEVLEDAPAEDGGSVSHVVQQAQAKMAEVSEVQGL
jgi:hypothetical protein